MTNDSDALSPAERKRREVAYLLWQINQGYLLAEDRAVGRNWMLEVRDPSELHPDDAAEFPGWLEAADHLMAIMDAEVSR